MKSIKRGLIFILLVFTPTFVKAECGYEERAKIQSLASNVSFTYNYKEDKDKHSINFSISITNLNQEIYIVNETRRETYYYKGNQEITINNFSDSDTVQFTIYGNTKNCKGEYLITNYVNLPPYNRFYNDKICKGISDYQLCNRFNKVTMTYDEFIKKVTTYKESLRQKGNEPNPNNENELLEKIIMFLSKYSFYLFGGIIIVCGGLLLYLKRKDEFDLK